MKKILVPIVAALAASAPQPASASVAAPNCHNGSVLPVVVNVRCYNGSKMCTVYVYADTDVLATQRICAP